LWIGWLLVFSAALRAQVWDTGGNGLLSGTYYFRYVAWQGQYDATNNLKYGIAVYGNIVFNNGAYTLSQAQEFDSQSEVSRSWTVTGTYSISPNGYGLLSSLFTPGDSVNILVSGAGGLIVGSSRNPGTGYNDLFLAAPLVSQASTLFNGTYTLIGVDDPTLNVADTRSYQMSLTFGTPSAHLSGYFALKGGTLATQSFSDIRFTYSNSAEAVSFGAELTTFNVDSDLMSGNKYLYISPDGKFVFGGSPNGWDLIVGVRQSSDVISGLYYRAGISQDDTPAAAHRYVNLNSWYGALNAIAGGTLIGHRRIMSASPNAVHQYDLTDSSSLSGSAGSYSDSLNQYSFSAGGTFGVGFQGLGNGSSLGIEVLVAAPAAAPSGSVYIYPNGIVNAGSDAPFSASWAPGELISIYGANLASAATVDGTLPTALGGAQVLINGVPAPIYSVSSGQINAVIPINLDPKTTTVATLQVTNDRGSSNTVFNYVGETQPGVFNSIGSVPAVQHADYSPVNSSHPARAGEILLIYLTGIGAIDMAGNATNTITASIGGIPAAIVSAGTGSASGGAYQMNATVPNGLNAGNVYLTISGPDSTNSSTVIPIGN